MLVKEILILNLQFSFLLIYILLSLVSFSRWNRQPFYVLFSFFLLLLSSWGGINYFLRSEVINELAINFLGNLKEILSYTAVFILFGLIVLFLKISRLQKSYFFISLAIVVISYSYFEFINDKNFISSSAIFSTLFFILHIIYKVLYYSCILFMFGILAYLIFSPYFHINSQSKVLLASTFIVFISSTFFNRLNISSVTPNEFMNLSFIVVVFSFHYLLGRLNVLEQSTASNGDNILNSMPDSLIVCDHTGKINHVNVNARRLLQYSYAELLRKNIKDLLPNIEENKHILNHYKTRNINNKEAFINTKRKKEVPILFSSTVLTDIYDAPRSMVFTIYDISQRKKEENLLIESQKDIEAKITDRTHELNEANIEIREKEEKLDVLINDFEKERKETFELFSKQSNIISKYNNEIKSFFNQYDLLNNETNPEEFNEISYENSKNYMFKIMDLISDISSITSKDMKIDVAKYEIHEIKKILDNKINDLNLPIKYQISIHDEVVRKKTVNIDLEKIEKITCSIIGMIYERARAVKIDINISKHFSKNNYLLFCIKTPKSRNTEIFASTYFKRKDKSGIFKEPDLLEEVNMFEIFLMIKLFKGDIWMDSDNKYFSQLYFSISEAV